jgi:Rieske Fe-S protein
MQSSNDPAGRRRFLSRIVTAIQAAIGGTLGVILGGAIVAPGLVRREENWLPAASLSNLPENEPIPVVLRVTREDGYSQVVDRKTVFLVKANDKVTAIDSTCTHLGCRVSWDAEAQVIKCPCHGGIYDRSGKVMSGPPPAPLANFATRVDGDQVLVQV